MNIHLETTQMRDIARWILFAIAFGLIIWNFWSISYIYNDLYNLEIEQNNNNLQLISNQVIKPSESLSLQRDITYSIIEIGALCTFLAFLYAGRIKIEGIKNN